MMRLQKLRLPLLLVLLFAGMVAHAKPAAQPLKLAGATRELYKKTPEADLYLYRFDPPDYDTAQELRPAVVFFFGGGWMSGKVTQFEAQARYLASRGMLAFVADYRVQKRHQTAPNACVEDGKSAIRWIRKNAKRLGVDPNRIVAGGGSAGGHVAAAAGMCDGFDLATEDLSVSSKPNALLLYNPVYDNSPDLGYGYERIQAWYPAISPAHNITPDDPPAIVFLGKEDKLIPVSVAEHFRDAMQAAGIQTELYLYDGQAHGFFNLGRAGFVDTLSKSDAFLVKLGYLSGDADMEAIQDK